MYKLLFLIISGQVLAQHIKREPLVYDKVGQPKAQHISQKTMIKNVTGQPITNLIREEKPSDKKGLRSNIDLYWQSLLQDLNGEPIAQDGRRRYKNKTRKLEAQNNTEQTMHKDVSPATNITEHLPTQDVTSQRMVQNITGNPLNPNIIEQPKDPKITEPSRVSTQQETIEGLYPNITYTAGSFSQTPDHNYHSPYMNPYKDSNYKISMPPIQTQEQWNSTYWHGEPELGDEELRQTEEFKQQEKRYKKMREEINNTTTTCEEFLNNTVFDPEKVVDKDWHTIYYWNVRDEDPYNMIFSRPTETMIKRFRDGLDKELRPPVDWSAAELFVETNVEYNALYVRTNVSGLYKAIPSAAFQYFGIPILHYALKIVNDEYLGIVNCKAKQCYALSDMKKLPQIEQIPKIAKSIGFHCLVNNSFVHTISLDDDDKDDLDDSSEDNFLGDYDTLNADPLQLDIF